MPHITSLTQADQDALFHEFVQEIHAGFPSPAADCSGERIDIARELTETEEDLLQHRTDGTDAFDTLYIGCSKFPQNSNFRLNFTGVV